MNYGRTNPGGRLSRRRIRFVLDPAFAAAGLLAPARPRKDGRVPSAHGLRATNIPWPATAAPNSSTSPTMWATSTYA